jgi:hypothetical protein
MVELAEVPAPFKLIVIASAVPTTAAAVVATVVLVLEPVTEIAGIAAKPDTETLDVDPMFDTPVTPENVVASRDASPPVAVMLIVSMPDVCTPAPKPAAVAATVTMLRVSEPAPPVSHLM